MPPRIIVLLIIITTGETMGSQPDHWGNYFVFTFSNQHGSESTIMVTTRESVNISVKFHDNNTEMVVFLEAWKSQTFLCMPTLYKKAISIESSKKVSVYAFTKEMNSIDGFLVLPVNALGTEYVSVNCNQTKSTILIAAVKNNTFLNTTCKQNSTNNNQLVSNCSTVILSAYDVIECSYLTDCLITSSHPIAVIGVCENYLPSFSYEMLPPTTEFGNEFMIVTPSGNESQTFIKIVSKNQTVDLYIQGGPYHLEPTSFLDIYLGKSETLCLNTSNPVLVVMFIKNCNLNTYVMMIVPPRNKYTNQYFLKIQQHHTSIEILKSTFRSESPGTNIPFTECSSDSFNVQYVLPTLYNYTFDLPTCVLLYSKKEFGGLPVGMKTSGIESCLNVLCHNGGWCLNDVQSFRCRCLSNFTGQFCEETTEQNSSHTTTVSSIVTPNTTTVSTVPTSTMAVNNATTTSTVAENMTRLDLTTSTVSSIVTNVNTANNETTASSLLTTTNIISNNTSVSSPVTTTDIISNNTTVSSPVTTTDIISNNTTESFPVTTQDIVGDNTAVSSPDTSPNITSNDVTTVIKTTATANQTSTETTIATTTTEKETVMYTTYKSDTQTANETRRNTSTESATTPTSLTESDSATHLSTYTETVTLSTANKTTASVDDQSNNKTERVSNPEITPQESEIWFVCSNINTTHHENSSSTNYIHCNNSVLYWCGCSCSRNQTYTEDSLLLDKGSLSKSFRKKNTALNYFASQKYLGISAVGITLAIICVIVSLDLTNVLKWFMKKTNRKNKRSRQISNVVWD